MNKIFTSSPKVIKVAAFSLLALLLASVGTVYFVAFKWVTVYYEDTVYRRVTFADSVKDVLDEIGLELREEDYVFPSRDQKLERITGVAVIKARPYEISHDGSLTTIWSVGKKVADVLEDAGIAWREQDVVLPPLESKVPEGKSIALVRVESEIVEEQVVLPHGMQRVPDGSLYRGQEVVDEAGNDGILINTIKVIYHDDEIIERTIIDSQLVVEAKDKIVKYGTISSISRSGYNIGISKVVDVRATAYCPGTEGSECPVDERGYSQCTGIASGKTATGRIAKEGKGTRDDPYIVAVDFRVIPKNSLVYLSFPGGGVTTRHGRIITDGFAIAVDTGSAIKGNRIDVLFDNHWVAWYFGVRQVRVFVIENIN